MASTGPQVYQRPSKLIDNHQRTFIPRRMPTNKSDQAGRRSADAKSPPLPPRDGAKTQEFPPRDGVSSLLRSTSDSQSRLRQPKNYGVNRFTSDRSLSVSSGKYSSLSRKSEKKEDTPPKLPPRRSPPKIPTGDIVVKQSSQKEESSNHQGRDTPSTPEPQPLTRTNVTKHDTIWNSETQESSGPSDLLVPPLQHITPESTAEMLEKFDPTLDVLESCSDSSADTMIMMTTEEEKRNEERILSSTQEYKSHQHGMNSGILVRDDTAGRDKPRVAFITPKRQLSEEEDISTDDGYGTNSSSGTNISSPLSSSSSSSTDMENSLNHNGLKSALKTSSSSNQSRSIIKPMISNSQPQMTNRQNTSWAVKRRAKLMESQDNTVQDQLRQLAIIEEEENSQDVSTSQQARLPSENRNRINPSIPGNPREPEDAPSRDLRRFEGELCDKFTDMDRNYRNYYDFDKNSVSTSEDSKVLYFQQKMMKQNYGNDNYYNPHPQNYSSLPRQIDSATMQYYRNDVPSLNLSKNMVSMPSLCPDSARSDYGSYPTQSWSNSSKVGSMDNSVNERLLANTSCDNFFPSDHSMMPNKGQFMSVENIHQNGKRPVFASSADIYNMFQSNNNLATKPACYRHSFHSVPASNALLESSHNPPQEEGIRPRAASTSVALQNKSTWNPFGGMFSRKKNKNTQKTDSKETPPNQFPENSDLEKRNPNGTLKSSGSLKQKIMSVKTKSREPTKPLPPKPAQNHVITQGTNHTQASKQYSVVPIIRQPRAMQMRNSPRVEESDKIQTMPVPRGMYDGRFKTVTLDEGNSQKLSTLV